MLNATLKDANPALWVYRGFWSAVDWIYPPACASCSKFGVRWCDECRAQVQALVEDICPKCGVPSPLNALCAHCQVALPPYTALRSWGRYNGTLRQAIHRLKYNHDLGLAETLSRQLIKRLKDLSWPVDLITAVPLSVKRISERGYNQSDLLAQPLALAQRVPFLPKAVFRTRETVSQVGLTAKERHENVRNAFAAQPQWVHGKSVLLIDDVATTGATLNYCSTALLQSGASSVYCLTLARAVLAEDHEKKV